MSLFIFIILLPTTMFASEVYMSGSPSQVQIALEAEFGPGSGVGAKEGSCVLCHASSDGGPSNIAGGGYGMDFMNAAIRLGITGRGGMSLPTLGATNSLQAIFADINFRNQDSDQDGLSNGEEYELNSDPNDNFIEGPTGLDDGGAGCYTVGPTKNIPPSNGLTLLIPLFLIVWLRLKKNPVLRKS